MTDERDRFDRELSERLRAHEERVPGGVVPQLTDAAARRAWAPLALVGAAGLVAGAVLVSIILQRPAPPTGEGTPSPSASERQGVQTPAPSVAAEVTITPMDGMLPGDTVVDMGRLGDEQIAVGQAADGLGLWVRRPGDAWSQVSDQEPLPSNVTGFYEFRDLAVGKAGAVAVGTWILPDSEFGTPRIAFTQGDMHWTIALGPSNPASGECGLINAVTETDGGWLAVGARCPESVTGSFRGVAWVSPNGTQWSELPLAGISDALGVAVGLDRIVAVGISDGGASASVSLDGGDTWQPADVSPEVVALTSVVYHDEEFVAMGTTQSTGNGTAEVGIWVSTDGLSWENVYRGGAEDSIDRLAVVGDEVVAVGGQFPSSAWTPDQGGKLPADTVEIWASTDGQNWSGPQLAYTAKSKMLVTGATVDPDGHLVIIASAILGADHTRVVPVLIEGPILGH